VNETRPLEAASRRLRRSPGRPRKHPLPPRPTPRTEVSPTPASTSALDAGLVRAPSPAVAAAWLFPPRVLDLEGAARYLSLSTWTVRELRAAGHLPALEVPGIRALRFDRLALDHAVEAWTDQVRPGGEPRRGELRSGGAR
jgi:excisionase family DNA binding protein